MVLDIYQDGGQNSGYGKGEQEPENIKVDEAEATELWEAIASSVNQGD